MSELRVLNNCEIGGCPAMNVQAICPECIHWTPSRGSKYYSCARWWSTRLKCDLQTSACSTCDHYIVPSNLPTGRPNESGMDWNDPEQVREYNRQKQRERRERLKNLE